MASLIKIEVVYALADEQSLFALSVDADTSVVDTIKVSGMLEKYPEINLDALVVGIYGKRLVDINQYTLQEGDRIEIYRPLQVDPKEARRKRAEKIASKKA